MNNLILTFGMLFLGSSSALAIDTDLEFWFFGNSYDVSGNRLNATVKLDKDPFDRDATGKFKVGLYAHEASDWTSTCSVSSTSIFDDLLSEKEVDPYFGSLETVVFDEANLDSKIWPIFGPKKYCIYAFVDTENSVSETNEGNNLFTFSEPMTYPSPTPTPTVTPSPTPTSGVSEVNQLVSLSLYPNPVANELSVSSNILSAQSLVVVNIFDLSGKRVVSINDAVVSGSVVRVDVSSLASGTYILELSTRENNFSRAAFVK